MSYSLADGSDIDDSDSESGKEKYLSNQAEEANKEDDGSSSVEPKVEVWDFEPFQKIKRDGQWSLNPKGIRWLVENLDGYFLITGTEGLPADKYEKCLKKKQRKWRRKLSDDYMAHFPNFKYVDILPPNPSKEEVRRAEKRVEVKIQNLLQERQNPDNAPDILKTLFRTLRRANAKDLWARESPDYPKLEVEVLEADEEWTPNLPRQQEFPIQMRIRAAIFKKLTAKEQQEWQEKANSTKQGSSTAEQVYTMILKLFATLGDVIVEKTGWTSLHFAELCSVDLLATSWSCYKAQLFG
ncbi:hypothetical protein M422DRAFT_253516 [Sphaerobolus stellatus SS14]|uniref:Uncharacterized protein n=1 Tax=Sphaerobolus stellatus (strain SS14) TaxID=990650 RepID=A0A0C9VXX9_SPHS4|nr:hypothetical protein M422DRAFT_253516 [Sphaerobolus stellatus SS14]